MKELLETQIDLFVGNDNSKIMAHQLNETRSLVSRLQKGMFMRLGNLTTFLLRLEGESANLKQTVQMQQLQIQELRRIVEYQYDSSDRRQDSV